MSKIVAVNLITNTGTYKLGSIVSAKDGSYYAIYPNKEWFKKTGTPQISPIKYSYHASGRRSRFTVGGDQTRVLEFGSEARVPIKSIKSSQGMIFLSLFDVNDNIEKMLDIAKGKRGYKEIVNLEASKYKNLTIRFFLVEKSFSLDKPRRDYKEVFRIKCDDIDILITTEDIWLGKPQKGKQKKKS